MAEPRVVLLPVIGAEVPAVPVKMFAQRVHLQHRSRPGADARADLHVPELGFASGQGTIKYVRLRQPRAVVHPVTRFHEVGGLDRRNPSG